MLHYIATLPLLLAEDAPTRFGGTEGPDLTRYFVVCAILVLVTGLVAWGFRRLVSGNLKLRATKRSLQTLDMLPLGGKRRLAVVRCYDRTFVLGLGDHEITPIAELDPVEAADAPVVPPAKADNAAFAAALEAVRAAMPEKRIASPRQPLTSPSADVVELSSPAKRVVRRKVKKAGQAKPKPKGKTTAKRAGSGSQALSVAAAAQEIVRDKQRARHEQRARAAKGQVAAPSPAKAPSESGAAEPQQRPPELPRLEGVLG